MFDSGFSELALILIVALIVVGPERLPGLVRKVGYWVGRFRRYATTVRAEIERELNADELRSMLSRQEDEIRELRDMLQTTRDEMRGEVDQIADDVRGATTPPATPPLAPDPTTHAVEPPAQADSAPETESVKAPAPKKARKTKKTREVEAQPTPTEPASPPEEPHGRKSE